MRNATALYGCLFGVTGIVDITDVRRELLESCSNPAFPAMLDVCQPHQPARIPRPVAGNGLRVIAWTVLTAKVRRRFSYGPGKAGGPAAGQ